MHLIIQGGLVAAMTAVSQQDLFKGLILSAAMVEIDPKAAGWLMVSFCALVLSFCVRRNL